MSGVWHIITPEYPPDLGGVAAYSALVARGLRDSGQDVHVWCRISAKHGEPAEEWVHPQAHGLLGPKGLREVNKGLDQFAGPQKLLVQWVPHGYGWRAMNVPFCAWVLLRALQGDEVQIMLHEAFLPFLEGTWRQSVAAAVQRLMTILLFGSTRRVWVSSPSWKTKVRPYALGKDIRFTWLPIPSNIPVLASAESVEKLRVAYTPCHEPLLGHFGTYGRSTSSMLDEIIPPVLSANPSCKLLLIGANGDSYQSRILARNPGLAGRIIATGASDEHGVSRSLMACDLMIQPYPEGVTARRGSCLAGLSHGKAVVTTSGEMTEKFWLEAPHAVAIGRDCRDAVSVTNRLLHNQRERQELGERAREHYQKTFAIKNCIRMLQLEDAESNC